MKVNRTYLYFLIAVVGLYTFYELRQPEELDWSETFHFRDDIPFGTKVTHDLLQEVVGGVEADHAFRSTYELVGELGLSSNLLMLSTVSSISKSDTETLLNYVLKGNTVLIGAENFEGYLPDSLGFQMAFDEQLVTTNISDVRSALAGESITKVRFINQDFPSKAFTFPSVVASTFLTELDDGKFEVLAKNEEGRAVLVKYMGVATGNLYLTSMPLALTNYFVLDNETSPFAEALLSLFPAEQPLTHNEYYQMGRMESSSSIRFLLRNKALKWAYFLLIGSLALFILFEMKRRQRIIPIIAPLKNTTLEFVNTLGRLHFRQSNHANLAKKRVLYWLDFVRNHYNISTNQIDKGFITELSNKSGKEKAMIELLVHTVVKVQDGGNLGETELLAFEKLLNKFYGLEN
jgi:hypothetical protein